MLAFIFITTPEPYECSLCRIILALSDDVLRNRVQYTGKSKHKYSVYLPKGSIFTSFSRTRFVRYGELTKCVVGTPTSIYCILMRVDWEICIGVYRQCDCDINSKKLISYQANADAIRKTIYFSEEITHSSPIPINNYRMLMGARVDVGNIA